MIVKRIQYTKMAAFIGSICLIILLSVGATTSDSSLSRQSINGHEPTTQSRAQARRNLQQHQPSYWFRQSSNGQWPHHLTLVLTFDANPDQVSWKFENYRTQKILAGVAFGEYIPATYANTVLEVPLDILTSEDYDGVVGEDAVAAGTRRDYRFVIYDRVSTNYYFYTVCLLIYS